jgi:predicted amidohydrolase
VKIGIVQLDVRPEASLQHTHECQRVMVGRLFADKANLVVLPECASHQYGFNSRREVQAVAEPLDGVTVRVWTEWARQGQGYIVGGLLEQASDGLYNTAVLVGPSGLLGSYRKMHRFGWEREWLGAGRQLYVWHIHSLRAKVGPLICYDLRFEYTVSALAAAGVDVLVVPTTWTSIGKSVLWDQVGYAPQNHLALGHAYAHRLVVACADRVGTEGSVTYLGCSLVAGPDGEVLLGPFTQTDAQSGLVSVDLERARHKRLGSSDIERDRLCRPDIPVVTVDVD